MPRTKPTTSSTSIHETRPAMQASKPKPPARVGGYFAPRYFPPRYFAAAYFPAR